VTLANSSQRGWPTSRRRSFMAQPVKHPKSGIYQLRRKVPEELRAALGHEYKRSLKTADAAEARRGLRRRGRNPKRRLPSPARSRRAERSCRPCEPWLHRRLPVEWLVAHPTRARAVRPAGPIQPDHHHPRPRNGRRLYTPIAQQVAAQVAVPIVVNT